MHLCMYVLGSVSRIVILHHLLEYTISQFLPGKTHRCNISVCQKRNYMA